MTMLAIGIYLRTLREARSLSRLEVAEKIQTSEQQIFRIEAGEIDTRGSLLLLFVDAVRGNADDLRRIVVNKLSTAEAGRELARSWLTQTHCESLNFSIHSKDDHDVPGPKSPDETFARLPTIALLDVIQQTVRVVRERLADMPTLETASTTANILVSTRSSETYDYSGWEAWQRWPDDVARRSDTASRHDSAESEKREQ